MITTEPVFFTSLPLPVEAVAALDVLFDAAFALQRSGRGDVPVHEGVQSALAAVGEPLFGEELFRAVADEVGDGAPSVWWALAALEEAGEVTPSPAVRAQIGPRSRAVSVRAV